MSTTNWCGTCLEECQDHPSVCTVCGTALTAPPANTTAANANDNHEASVELLRQAGRDLHQVLGSLRGQIQDLETLTRNILEHQQQNWQQTIPPELWDPQNGAHKARPTSQKALQQIPRIVLQDKSTLFRQGTLQTCLISEQTNEDPSTNSLNIAALIGEFGPIGEHHFQNVPLVVASPLTGRGGLSVETINLIEQARDRPVVFLQRGDGMTFVQKALLAQNAGAAAVIIGNNTSSPWPYVMKDSKNEAETHRLAIPVVMVKEADAKEILIQHQNHTAMITCNLHITSQSHDCVVCCEPLQTTETVVQLPGCAHIFHEACAMAWLKSHNTCPYCRRELPTDDEEYERERRRQQRTHAGQSGGDDDRHGNSAWNEYYG